MTHQLRVVVAFPEDASLILRIKLTHNQMDSMPSSDLQRYQAHMCYTYLCEYKICTQIKYFININD